MWTLLEQRINLPATRQGLVDNKLINNDNEFVKLTVFIFSIYRKLGQILKRLKFGLKYDLLEGLFIFIGHKWMNS